MQQSHDLIVSSGLGKFEEIDGIHVLVAESGSEESSDWMRRHGGSVRDIVKTRGALLIRGLEISGSKQLGNILAEAFCNTLVPYYYRSTPRTQFRGNVYSATEYHSTEVILQHNENSYSDTWPEMIGFCCMQPSLTGGETPIADSSSVFKKIPYEISEKFVRKGIKYVRNYQDVDLPWPEVFQTKDRTKVESYCTQHGIHFEWIGESSLRTSQVNQAAITHPATNEWVWFNQAHLFHVSSLSQEVAGSLISVLGEENLPRNAYFGDGSKIDPEELEIIRAVYRETEVSFSWKKNDLLLLDNMRYSHGRKSFTGERKVLVGMAGAVDYNAVSGQLRSSV